MFNIKRGYPIKRLYISPDIAPRGSECENNLFKYASQLFMALPCAHMNTCGLNMAHPTKQENE